MCVVVLLRQKTAVFVALLFVVFFALAATQSLAAEVLTHSILPGFQEDESQICQTKIQADIVELPLSFIANAGQANANVQFIVKAGEQTIFFTPQAIVFATSEHTEDELTRGSVVRLRFTGANEEVKVGGEKPLPGVANFFLGNDPEQWRANVPTYAAITYHDLYPGIDLVYSGKQGRLKSEFVVAAGADPTVIIMDYSGVSSMYVRDDGSLVLETPIGKLVEEPPLIYQVIDEARITVEGGYRLLGEGQVAFSLGEYVTTEPLIIDPAFVYSTYLGGSIEDYGRGIAVDGLGNAYVTGETISDDFPTQDPLQPYYGGGDYDAFVVKLNPSGSALVYSTYLGGSADDRAHGIAVDSWGNAYITGYTYSDDFPTQNPLQPDYGGVYYDAFVAKLNPSGSALVYSTYLGGSIEDYGRGIAVDASGNAYVTGETISDDFPTQNPLQPEQCTGLRDAFVAKLNPSGSALVYSTYLGGRQADGGYGIAVDSLGNAYVTGYTFSDDFPTQNPLHPGDGGIYSGDVFVAKLNPLGSALVYSTYLGGSNRDYGHGIAVDSWGNAYITGYTYSDDFPTQNPLQPDSGGGNSDAFVAKLNPSGSALLYSTYLGGTGGDQGWDVAVDGSGNAYVTGATYSVDFPTQNPLQPYYGGEYSDAFVAKLNPSGSALVYSTYLGGRQADGGYGIAVDSWGNAYITGYTYSDDFPTQDPLQPNYGGGWRDVFVAKIGEANGQVVDFPDPNLEQAIREAINKPTGDIYDTDLIGLTSLNAEQRGIANLEGIQHCVDLTILYLYENEIVDISPLAGLTNLTILWLIINQIVDISPLAGLTNLTWLDLRGNEIVDISPLAGLTSLTELVLGNNEIVDISPLAGLTSLTELWLSGNETNDISALVDLTRLTYLGLDDNQISDISALAGLTDLTELGLADNQISDISTVAGLTYLRYLTISGNEINDISALVDLTRLTYLGLGGNEINDISALAGLTHLGRLGLGNNQIVDISPLSGLINLAELYLYDNQISDITPLVSNAGIDSGDNVHVESNYLTLVPGSADMQNIQALINRGVNVYYDPQNPPENHPPIANAGPDQTVTDTDGNGSEDVTLDGSGSDDPDGDIVSWVWTEGGSQIATGGTPTVTLPVGVHTITLTVTDDDGATDTDEVVITVQGVSPSPVITATKTGVDLNGGTLILGDHIEYTIVIRNLGGRNQPDNPGNEFEDVLSTGLGNLGYVTGSAFASSGTVEYKSSSDPWYRKIVWNGSIPAGGSVTIRFTSPVNWGTEASNQGTVYYDSGGGGTNDASVLTDDPNLPGNHDPTVLAVSPNLTLTLVDPIPELIDPNNPPTYIDADTRSVSFLGRRVTGVAADGVARLVLQLEINPPTTGTVTLSIEDPDLATPSSQDGVLFNIGGTESGTTITVPVNKVGGSAYALAVYRSPEDFVRPEMVLDDEASRERSIYIKADYQGSQTSFPIRITRPPVVLIHGLWGSRSGWNDFELLDDDKFWIRVFDYETTNDESFDVNSRRVFAQTMQAVRDYKRDKDVAAVQVDAVTHSMGGVLARAAYGLEAFWTNEPTFGEGYFHKVISIGTPHFGSRWASILQHFYSGWDYWRHVLSDAMDFDPFNNALEDLARGSLAIQHLTDTEGPLSHNIVGITPEPDSLSASVFLAGISLHPDVNYKLFTAIFGGLENDLIVGVDSQRGGFAVGVSTTSEFSPVIHTGNSWLQKISANTVYETQHFSIAQKAIELLNQPLHSNLFAPLPAISWSSSETAFFRGDPCSTSAAQGGITISSPQDGALFGVGETVTVTAQPTDGVILDMVFLGSPGFLLLDDATPFEFTFDLPEDCVGPRDISVLGVDTSGNTYLDEITINVVTSAALTNLGVDPEEIEHLQVGDSVILHVWGDFSDGQTIDLTEAPETSYSSDNNGAASVDTDGVVTGVGKGSGVITVTYGDQTVTANVNVEASNDRPIAEAGPDQTAAVGNSVHLNGAESSDPNGDSLTYLWEIVSRPGGSAAALLNPDAVDPTLTPDIAGEYIAKLVVDDGNGETDSDTVLVTAMEETPAVFRVEGSTGNVYSDASYYGQSFETGSADVAEWVPVSEPVEPGDILELDPDNPGHYRKSRGPCSNLVAGVVSTKPGFVLGGDATTPDSGLPATDRALLALLGIVPAKVTDEGGPIHPGDLLVTSSTPGCAMRWDPSDTGSPCALVGKALEPLEEESGIILVLLTSH